MIIEYDEEFFSIKLRHDIGEPPYEVIPIYELLELWQKHKALPSADRPQGEWIETPEGTMCSNCHKYPYDDGEYHIANWHSDYCPNCGCRMKGADDDL